MQLLESLYQIVTQYIASWGYWGLILGMAMESACMPIPSEIVLPFGGYMVSKGILTYWGAVAAGLGGGTLGSVVAYVVGFYGGRPFILKYGRYILLNEHDIERAEYWFDRFGTKVVFWARFLPIVRTFISLPAGISGMNFWRFLIYTVLGSLPWTILFIYLGMKLGDNWARVRTMFEEFDTVVLILVIGLFVYAVISRLRNRSR